MLIPQREQPINRETETRTRYNYENQTRNLITEPSEWDSGISWAESERKPRGEVDFDQKSYLLTEGNINTNEEFSPMSSRGNREKVTDIISLWTKETERNKNKPIKGKPQAKIDIMSLKKFLLSNEETDESALKSAKNTKASIGESILDSPYGNFTNRVNTEESPKKSRFSYNPYGGSTNNNLSLGMDSYRLTDTSQREGVMAKWIQGKITKKQETPFNAQNPGLVKSSFHGKNVEVIKNKLQGSSEKKEQSSKLKVTFPTFIIMLKLMKKRLKARYFRNRTEVYKYDPLKDPPVKKVVKRNPELIKKRNKFAKEDKKFKERNNIDLQENCSMEPFDFSGHSSIFGQKDGLLIQAYTTEPKYGRLTKAGIVQKVINNKFHQRWLALRSFYLYFYQGSYSSQAKEMASLPVSTLNEVYIDAVQSQCISLENSRGKTVNFVSDDDWKITLENSMAHKRYMLVMFKENLVPKACMLEYFENEGCRALDLSQENINDPQLMTLVYNSLRFHPKLKELNLSRCQIRGRLLDNLIDILLNLKKTNRIEVLNLDSNGIISEMMDPIHKYLSSDTSFALKKLSLSYNPIGDQGLQSFFEVLYSRFVKMNSDSKSKLELPLGELSLSGTKMGDQSIFSLITTFEQITKTFKERGVEDHRELISIKMAENLISDNGMIAFSYAISNFRALKELDLSNNVRVTNKSFSYLLNSLGKGSSVSRLDYLKNAIDVKTLEGLFASLADNFLLKRLSITITEKMIEAFIVDKEVIRDFYKITTESK